MEYLFSYLIPECGRKNGDYEYSIAIVQKFNNFSTIPSRYLQGTLGIA